jgi:hypothetical protein
MTRFGLLLLSSLPCFSGHFIRLKSFVTHSSADLGGRCPGCDHFSDIVNSQVQVRNPVRSRKYDCFGPSITQ